MEQKFISQLISDYDQLLKLPREAYEIVIPYLKQVALKRGTVIKEYGKADVVSRYLCEGFIGSFNSNGEKIELFSIFKPSDTVFDEVSFRTGIASSTVLRTISDVIFLEFPSYAESKLLAQHSRFLLLAHRVAHRITERNSRVHAIAKLGLENGYAILMKEFFGLEREITNSDLGSFFGVSTRTVERWKHDLKSKSHD
ncbi:Crp/Fnr family transcriptional regulator [Algoriphagus sp. H41]|uniref:Crp/Fnr family transcriptional regulator n=1 Tax=Algoriphagus oliviformis TaxID=2811231 RepID=A0ABS3BXD8_9BACT|nr:Crp/Fnr family transcriptional regulator [Algoriphagus oliviformis]MBN7809524.1 Crp/Fnr family transcriptional regulator [Algoriphagus oliviformis]